MIEGQLGGVLIPRMPERDFGHAAMMARSRLSSELEVIEVRMLALRDATRDVPGWRVCLDLQRRKAAGKSMALRWRKGDGGYVPDNLVMSLLSDYPPSLRNWYHTVQLHAAWLNAMERICRKAELEYQNLGDGIAHLMQHFSEPAQQVCTV